MGEWVTVAEGGPELIGALRTFDGAFHWEDQGILYLWANADYGTAEWLQWLAGDFQRWGVTLARPPSWDADQYRLDVQFRWASGSAQLRALDDALGPDNPFAGSVVRVQLLRWAADASPPPHQRPPDQRPPNPQPGDDTQKRQRDLVVLGIVGLIAFALVRG